MNEIPFAALQPHSQQQQQQSVSEVPAEDAAATSIWGSGFTSEGIDQNPALYDFLMVKQLRLAGPPSLWMCLHRTSQLPSVASTQF